MGFKGRTKFAIAGIHPLLSITRDHFIQKGLALVPWNEDPDFCVIGADIGYMSDLPLTQLDIQQTEVTNKPVLLLSSHDLFTKNSNRAFYASVAEHVFTKRQGPTLILRPHNVYGPDIKWGVVHKFIYQAKKRESLTVCMPGYHTRFFLYQDDFLMSLDKFLPKLLKGLNASFSIGGPYAISMHRLADSVWQTVTGSREPAPVKKVLSKQLCPFSRDVDNEAIKMAIGWKPGVTVRSGLFRMLSSVQK